MTVTDSAVVGITSEGGGGGDIYLHSQIHLLLLISAVLGALDQSVSASKIRFHTIFFELT